MAHRRRLHPPPPRRRTVEERAEVMRVFRFDDLAELLEHRDEPCGRCVSRPGEVEELAPGLGTVSVWHEFGCPVLDDALAQTTKVLAAALTDQPEEPAL